MRILSAFEESVEQIRRAHSGGHVYQSTGQTLDGPQPVMPHLLQKSHVDYAREHAQKRDLEIRLAHEKRPAELQWKAKAPLRAERVVMGQPPIFPLRPPHITKPSSFHILNRNSIFSTRHPEFQNGRYASESIESIFDLNGGWHEYKNRGSLSTYYRIGQQGIYTSNINRRVTDTETVDADLYNVYVNATGQFQFYNVNISDEDFINYLLGNMITGLGPENYVFPTDGYVSQRAAKGVTFDKALYMWYKLNERVFENRDFKNLRGRSFKVDYHTKEQAADFVRTGTPFTVQNFIGSAWATVELVGNDKIKITIFNISSLTSGDGAKHLPWNNYARSIKRVPGRVTPFGNISTTFSVTRKINYDYALHVQVPGTKEWTWEKHYKDRIKK